jgi:hypothetical protein
MNAPARTVTGTIGPWGAGVVGAAAGRPASGVARAITPARAHLYHYAVRGHEHDVCEARAVHCEQDARLGHRLHLLLEGELPHLLDPVELRWVEIGIAVAHFAHRPHARGHQGVTGLVVVLFLAVDQGDLGPVKQGMEPVGHGNAAEASAQNHDVRLRLGFGRLGSGRGAGQNGRACRAQQPLAAAQRGG